MVGEVEERGTCVWYVCNVHVWIQGWVWGMNWYVHMWCGTTATV